MSDPTVKWIYSDSQEQVKKGDLVMVDEKRARIEEVCMAGTALADSFSCEDTGGLLIRYEDDVLVLVPFGHHHRITKLLSSTQDK